MKERESRQKRERHQENICLVLHSQTLYFHFLFLNTPLYLYSEVRKTFVGEFLSVHECGIQDQHLKLKLYIETYDFWWSRFGQV